MNVENIIELPVFIPVEKIIKVVGALPHSFFLDSSDPAHPASLYSYAGITPKLLLTGNDNPWPKLKEATQKGRGARMIHPRVIQPSHGKFPFTGGWVGFLAYENYMFLEPWVNHPRVNCPWVNYPSIPVKKTENLLPGYWFGFYEFVLIVDHKNQKSFLASPTLSQQQLLKKKDRWFDCFERVLSKEAKTLETPPALLDPLSIPSFENYERKIAGVKNHLACGDVYQINLTERFQAATSEPADKIYGRLRTISPAPYSAFIHGDSFQILSTSPESFIEITDGYLATRPIKGTRRRGLDSCLDAKHKKDLISSTKDHAELLMIVDLLRNDLGKICEFGSVKADYPFAVESFAQVHHQVGKVYGRLKKGIGPVEAIKALFPGGSITGAPKIAAMCIIHELEEKPRSVYTGALGYMNHRGNIHMNLPIRTLTKINDKVYFHAGCGIVADSEPRAEYDEMMAKAEGIIRALLKK